MAFEGKGLVGGALGQWPAGLKLQVKVMKKNSGS